MMEEGEDVNDIIAVDEAEEEEEDEEEESVRFEEFSGSVATTTFITGLSFFCTLFNPPLHQVTMKI